MIPIPEDPHELWLQAGTCHKELLVETRPIVNKNVLTAEATDKQVLGTEDANS